MLRASSSVFSRLSISPERTRPPGIVDDNSRICSSALRNVTRIVHADDIAPKYPLPLGYRHGGEAWHLAEDGALLRDTSV
jgi:hypothetical protein